MVDKILTLLSSYRYSFFDFSKSNYWKITLYNIGEVSASEAKSDDNIPKIDNDIPQTSIRKLKNNRQSANQITHHHNFELFE